VSTSTGYIPQSTIATAVESLLGFRGFGENIELDALMMQDINGAATSFDPGDNIYFSIRQIGDTGDPDGFYATGSEIFTLESTAAGISPGFLFHGGHFWDHAWTLDYMAFFDTAEQVWLQLDVDAIESVSVPEPASILLIGLAGAVTLLRRRS